ncbi:nuclear transport factor 2 family protein [Algoriphagus lutimaris]|uniref:ATP-binding protein n=1 Tax=Algoriphagus lutimaris TaxID=613197 RepID=UPI00196BA61C|nr:ATP-binding protein [Algoriphagus lutimaris]MBN3521001.1 nuclear transport factor 2 family protein [Algoriphagus lutimaris]
MGSEKERLLEKNYDRIANVGYCLIPYEDLRDIIHPNAVVFGTAKDEHLFTFEQIDKLFKAQYIQMSQLDSKIERNRIATHLSLDGNHAIIIELVNMNMASEDVTIHLELRTSCSMEYIDGTWVLTHWHASTAANTENDPWHLEEWRRERETLQDLVDQQTEELLLKNRELEIETALERIRARSLAMQHTDELSEVITLIFKILNEFNIAVKDGVALITFDEGSKDLNEWMANAGFDSAMNFYLPYFEHPVLSNLWEAKNLGKNFLTHRYSSEESRSFHSHIFEYSDFKHTPQAVKEYCLAAETYATSIAFQKNTAIFINDYSGTSLTPPEIDLLKKFSNVFEQTYTRFLDIQKAEAQARESQIEASLERVRSRSLAMHHSSELSSVVDTLLQEFTNLEFTLTFCIINLIDEHDKSNTVWAANPETGKDPESYYMKFEDYPFHHAMWEAWKAQKKRFVYTIEGEEKKIYDEYLYSETEFSRFPKHVQEANKGLDRYVAGFTFFKYSGLQTVSEGYISEEDLDILERFGKVFEQAYTRFLDLKKVESQAREAQIEAALERVRSSSMAMHKSDDLLLVIKAVHEQITELGIKVDASNFQTYIENSRDFYLWAITNTHSYQQKLRITYIDFGMTKKMWDAWEKGESFVEIHSDAEEMHSWWNKAFEVSELSHTPQHRREIILSAPGWNSIVARRNTVGLQLHRYNLESFTDQEKDILERLATVFEQSYTRFLDLQKAERQAREAQIEAALERIRSRSMAMHKTSELSEVILVLFKQFEHLNLVVDTCYIDIFDEDNQAFNVWIGASTAIYPKQVKLPYCEHPIHQLNKEARQNGIEFFTFDEDKRSKEKYFEHFYPNAQGIDVPKSRMEYIDKGLGISGSAALGKYSGITMFNYQKIIYSKEENDILKRVNIVFQQTYTRFLDLQKAEAQAREATKQSSLDRVRAEIASMRTAKDLERITPLVWKELRSLGVPFFRCGVMLVNEEKQKLDFYLSNPEGKALAALHLDYDNSEITRKGVDHWRQQATYIEHWSEEQFLTFTKSLLQQGQISDLSTYQGGDKPPTSLTLQFVPFAQGMVYVGSEIDLNEEELDLVAALGRSLSVAYARYEDFTRLDVAKAKAEQALKDLKAAQEQLVQQEKLASLGQLTAGIAHEIKNPLNFVNNFSDLSSELIEEVFEELENIEDSISKEEIIAILEDVQSNLKKVHEHGTRADGIVKSMLQHSRGGAGKVDNIPVNDLVQEFVKLSFHGMRAGKNPINVDLDFQLDEQVGEVDLVMEDFSRVILNIANNAFDAMREKLKNEDPNSYLPKFTVKTERHPNEILLTFKDNGPGIPKKLQDKILQPFFTTKKGTEGTGLGLSITHDIIKAHGGKLSVESEINQSTSFTITIPISQSVDG